jgi:hypothetical protein
MSFNLSFSNGSASYVVQLYNSSEVVVLAVQLSNTLINMPAMNANDVIGNVSVITSPPGHGPNTPITLGGTDAAKFALSNSGNFPCNLTIGSANVAAGTYNISLSAN